MKDKPVLHACAFPGCAQRVAVTRLACIEHWFLLPPALREVLYREYRAASLAGRRVYEGATGDRPPHRLLALMALSQAHWAGEGARLSGRDDGVDACLGALERAKFQRRLGLSLGESDPFVGFELVDVLYDAEALGA